MLWATGKLVSGSWSCVWMARQSTQFKHSSKNHLPQSPQLQVFFVLPPRVIWSTKWKVWLYFFFHLSFHFISSFPFLSFLFIPCNIFIVFFYQLSFLLFFFSLKCLHFCSFISFLSFLFCVFFFLLLVSLSYQDILYWLFSLRRNKWVYSFGGLVWVSSACV